MRHLLHLVKSLACTLLLFCFSGVSTAQSVIFSDHFDSPACGHICATPNWLSESAGSGVGHGFDRASASLGGSGANTVSYDGTPHVWFSPETGPYHIWGVSPALNVIAGRTYEVSYQGVAHGAVGGVDTMRVFVGGAQTTAAMTTELAAYVHHVDEVRPIAYQRYATQFTATTTGTVHVGLKMESVGDLDYFFLDEFAVTEVVPVSCWPVSGLSATAISHDSVALSWSGDPRNGTSDFIVEYGPAGYTPGSGSTVAATSTTDTLVGLTQLTAYDIYVRAICGSSDTSSRLYTSYTSPMGPQAIPWGDDFNASCHGLCDLTGWTTPIPTGRASSQRLNLATGVWDNGPNSTNHALAYGSSAAVPRWYYSPSLLFEAGKGYIIKRTRRSFGVNGGVDTEEIYLGGSPSASAMTHLVQTSTLTTGPTGTITEEIEFVAPFTGALHLGFKAVPVGGLDGLSMDDFSVIEAPSCWHTTSIASQASGVDQVTLSWTHDTRNATRDYVIEYGLAGFARGTGTVVAVDTNVATVGGLSVATTYDFYVTADCGGGDLSSAAVITVTTPTPLPYVQDFNAACNGACPIPRWATPKAPGGSTYTAVHQATAGWGHGPNGTNHALAYGTNYASERWYFPPGIFVVAGREYGVTRTRKDFDVQGGLDSEEIHLGAHPTANSMSVVLGTRVLTAGTSTEEFRFTPTETGMIYLGFKQVASDGLDGTSFDDFAIVDVCPPVHSVHTISAPDEIVVNWTSDPTNAGATKIVEYGLVGFTQGTGTSVSTTGTSATISGLTAGTVYDIYVGVDCGGGTTLPATYVSAATSVAVPYATSFEAPGVAAGARIAAIQWTQQGDAAFVGRNAPEARTGDDFIVVTSGNAFVSHLASPALTLAEGTTYVVEGYYTTYGSLTGEAQLSFTIGSTADSTSHTQIPLRFSYSDASAAGGYRVARATYTAPADTVVYFGVRPKAVGANCGLRFDDFSVRELADASVGAITTTGAGTCETAAVAVTASAQSMGFLPVNDAAGNLVALVNPNGNDLGAVTAEAVDLAATSSQGGLTTLSRNVNLVATNGPGPYTANGGVQVMLPFVDAEMAELVAALGGGSSDWSQLTVSHYSDAATEDCDVANNLPGGYSQIPLDTVLDYGTGAKLLAFTTTGFSEFTAGASAPLPVQLVDFSASAKTGHTALAWRTASEVDASHFAVERSDDGQTFRAIAEVAASGRNGAGAVYAFDDYAPVVTPVTYYRLRIVDLDGGSARSEVIPVARGSGPGAEGPGVGLAAYPQPAGETLTLEFEAAAAGEVVLALYDAVGRATVREVIAVAAGAHTRVLDLADLPQGAYVLRVTDAVGRTDSRRVVRR